jgi:hypothetical protein
MNKLWLIHFLQKLNRCTHQEDASTHQGYLYSHEHDLEKGHLDMEPNGQILTCSLCNISYCKKCGKEVITIESN